jgi:phosphate:Na+ symporter
VSPSACLWAATRRQPGSEKAELRSIELAAGERHFERLREGRPESIETSSLHLDVLRDLRRIHSHLCSVAYPVLEAAGDLPVRRNADIDPTPATIAYESKLP